MNREPKIIKRFETKIIDLSGDNELSSKRRADEQITRLENRFKQSNGQENKTNELLFDLLRGLNERIGALENKS